MLKDTRTANFYFLFFIELIENKFRNALIYLLNLSLYYNPNFYEDKTIFLTLLLFYGFLTMYHWVLQKYTEYSRSFKNAQGVPQVLKNIGFDHVVIFSLNLLVMKAKSS